MAIIGAQEFFPGIGDIPFEGPGSDNPFAYQYYNPEQEVLGIDHAEVGACLLEHWNLPGSLVEAVRWHHQGQRGVRLRRCQVRHHEGAAGVRSGRHHGCAGEECDFAILD